MRTTSMKLGFPAAIALAGCAALHAPQAAAQSRNAERCTTIDNDAERLACYDRSLRPAAAPKPAPSPAPTAAANTRAPVATPPAAVDPIAPAPSTTVATENRATRREREVRESTASAPPAAPAAPAAPTAAPTRRAPTAKEAADIVPIVIVQIRALPGRGATFVTDKGETWVQTDAQRQWPEVPFKAAIKPGSMGSTFLVPDDYAHSFRVRHGQ